VTARSRCGIGAAITGPPPEGEAYIDEMATLTVYVFEKAEDSSSMD
jgi:hypothetical protein